MATATIETKQEALAAKILAAAANGNTLRMEDLLEEMWEAARQDGMQDLMLDLVDAEVIDDEAVAFAAENNGVKVSRR